MLRKIVNLLRLVLSARRLNAHLATENLALRQQLAILLRDKNRPKLRKRTVSSGSCFLQSGMAGIERFALSSLTR